MNLREQFEKETGKKAPFHGDYLPYGNSYGFACAERDYYSFYTKWLEAKVSRKYWCCACGEFVPVFESDGDILCEECKVIITSFKQEQSK